MLNKILFTIITALLFHQWARAQVEFGTVRLPSRVVDDYWVVPDDRGNLCVQYYKRPNLYFELIDSRGEKITQIKQPFKYKPTILAGNYSGGHFQFYYEPRSRKKEGDIGAFTVSQSEGKFSRQIRYDLKANKSEAFTGHFNMEGNLYLLIQLRGSNLIRIARLNGQDEGQVKNFTAPELLKKAFDNYDPIIFVDPLEPKSVFRFQSTKKVYADEGKIIFTFDHPEQFKTMLWSIDWEEGTSELKSIPAKKMVFGRSSNSFLHEGRLFRLTVDEVKLDLSVYDLAGRDSVRSYNHTGDGPIAFKSGPVFFIDEFGTQHRMDNVKNDKLFKTFSNGNPSIFVERINQGNVKVTVGSFNEVATGLSIGGSFGSFGRVGGVALGGARQLTGTRRGSTFIHSYLTYPGLGISKSDDLITPNERIYRYLDNKKNISVSKVYSYNSSLIHLAYIDYNKATLHIVEFRN